MLEENLKKRLLNLTESDKVISSEIIQELWSGYGKILRINLAGGKYGSIVVKKIHFPNQTDHPRGWNTLASHNRKVKSYEVEKEWYTQRSTSTNHFCRIPQCLGVFSLENEDIIVLEDLNTAGFNIRKIHLTIEETKLGLRWLAHFHALYMNQKPYKLWDIGTYWHLATRKDEFEEMPDNQLKRNAEWINQQLNACKFQTIVHGDAKLANFCFSEDMQQLAAVDFQYVGGGCGMKDVIYFLSSCLTEQECEANEIELLDCYFEQLQEAISAYQIKLNFNELEEEWRKMYAIAWADFIRFLQGWSPDHYKLNAYSLKQVEIALSKIE